MDQTKVKANADESEPKGTPSSKSYNKREATSPLYSEVLLHKKPNRQDSADSSISDIESVVDMADIADKNNIRVDGTQADGDEAVHVMSQPMNPSDIIKIATELRSIMLPEMKALLDGMMPDIKQIVAEAVKEATNTLSAEVQELKRENQQLVKNNHDLERRVVQLELDSDALEQYSRRNTIRISGLPEVPSEDTDGAVLAIARELDVSLTPSDIDRSHRVGRIDDNRASGSGRRSRDIIVKFATYNARQRLYVKRKNLRQTESLKNIFINEDLTKKRSKLLYDARCLVRTKKLKSAYASDGKIFVRDNLDHRHLIRGDADLLVFIDQRESRTELAGSVALPPPGLASPSSDSVSPGGAL